MQTEEGAPAPEGEAQPVVEPETEPQESNDGDDWSEAKEAFFEGSFDNSEEEPKEEAGSHLEAGEEKKEEVPNEEPVTEFDVKVDLKDLPVPHKYKPLVQKKVDAILAQAKVQSDKLTEGYKESNAALAKAFVDIIRSDDPLKTLKGYAEQIVQPEALQNLEKRINAPANVNESGVEKPQFDASAIQQRLKQEISSIEDKYWPLLESEQDPKRSRELFSRMEQEKMALLDAVNSAKQQAVLMAFYNKLIKPKFDEFGSLKQEAESEKAIARRSAKVSLWNAADQEVGKTNPDWPKYRAKVKELLKTRYKGAKDGVNSTGKGHLELMKDIYLIVSRQDHLDAAKRPVRGNPGLKPGGKHIETQKAGGSDWDSIKERFWSDRIRSD